MSERCKGMVFKESSGASGKIFKHSLSIAIETCHFQVQSGPSREREVSSKSRGLPDMILKAAMVS